MWYLQRKGKGGFISMALRTDQCAQIHGCPLPTRTSRPSRSGGLLVSELLQDVSALTKSFVAPLRDCCQMWASTVHSQRARPDFGLALALSPGDDPGRPSSWTLDEQPDDDAHCENERPISTVEEPSPRPQGWATAPGGQTGGGSVSRHCLADSCIVTDAAVSFPGQALLRVADPPC
jgi:hypothetical protein